MFKPKSIVVNKNIFKQNPYKDLVKSQIEKFIGPKNIYEMNNAFNQNDPDRLISVDIVGGSQIKAKDLKVLMDSYEYSLINLFSNNILREIDFMMILNENLKNMKNIIENEYGESRFNDPSNLESLEQRIKDIENYIASVIIPTEHNPLKVPNNKKIEELLKEILNKTEI